MSCTDSTADLQFIVAHNMIAQHKIFKYLLRKHGTNFQDLI